MSEAPLGLGEGFVLAVLHHQGKTIQSCCGDLFGRCMCVHSCTDVVSCAFRVSISLAAVVELVGGTHRVI